MIAGAALAVLMTAAAPAADGASDPDLAAFRIAAGSFKFACAERLSTAADAAAYAGGASEIARQTAAQTGSLPYTLEGVGGDTCRVTYHGAHVEALWARTAEYMAKLGPACTASTTASLMSAVCTATPTQPAYAVRIERADDRMSLSITWKGPRAQ